MKKVVLFQGDSITDAGRNKEQPDDLGKGYPHLIAAVLGFERPEEYAFVNRGVSGNRVLDMYARIVADLMNIKPDLVSVLIGVNDVWHGLSEKRNGTGAARYRKIYDIFLSEVREELPETKIMVLEPFVLRGEKTDDREDDPARWSKFSAGVYEMASIARELALKHGAAFVPLQSVFDEALKRAPGEHWLKDGVHPTPAGHELIRREWMKAFAALTEETK